MNAPVSVADRLLDREAITEDLALDIEHACARIAPSWPLDRLIAVNPLWGFIDASLEDAAARYGALTGHRFVMGRRGFRDAFARRVFSRAHIERAIAERGSAHSLAHVEHALTVDDEGLVPRALVTDVVDARRDLERQRAWRDIVVDDISAHCASVFDRGQASLRLSAQGGLYASYRRRLVEERLPEDPIGVQKGALRASLSEEIPRDPRRAIADALDALDVPQDEREEYLLALLMSVNGWASWCAYLRFTARQEGRDDDHIVELLAMRITWERLLLEHADDALRATWQLAMSRWPSSKEQVRAGLEVDFILQRALEIAYQEGVAASLASTLRAQAPEQLPAAQVAFCIDVRSEVFRRALESERDDVATRGFAGFFGLPIDYQPVGASDTRPQLPGPLAPRLRAADRGVTAWQGVRRRERLSVERAINELKSGALSSFAFVESMGLLYAAKLVTDSLGITRPATHPERAGLRVDENLSRKPRLTSSRDGRDLPLYERCDLATTVLRSMGLTDGFARVVVLLGHGSDTVNNPQAGALDCGACCGQTGEVNARALAALLNGSDVRLGLAERGIDIPRSTHFVAGLHHTTTDEISLFDLDELPNSHVQDIAELKAAFERAGVRARRERSERLGLAALDDEELVRALRARTRDWSELRPEWGLADNAAFVVAPRARTRGLDLGGRAFLHDYEAEHDKGFSVLELIMTAPMIVTHWINLQYYASTVDPTKLGSGNKVLHNVVGGSIGVLEGGKGDLRVGLSRQSVVDGERMMHTPVRLSVFIEAPMHAILSVIAKHEPVRHLVDGEWLHLFQIDPADGVVRRYQDGSFVAEARAPLQGEA